MESEDRQMLVDIVNGFFGGLAAEGVRSIDPRPAEFEAAFSRAWTGWKPASSGELARLALGRYGYKAILYRARWPKSFFRHYQTSIDACPSGLDIEQFLLTWAAPATPGQWRELAKLYLQHAVRQTRRETRPQPATEADEQSSAVPAVRVPVVGRNGIRVPGGLVRRAKDPGTVVHTSTDT
jgi:hypothetical protein